MRLIVVECYLDQYVVQKLGFTKKNINHQSGKGSILRTLMRGKGKIGIIDEDPGKSQPRSLDDFEEIEDFNRLLLLQNKQDSTLKLIQIPIDMEHWILKRAKENNIDIQSYGFPSNPQELHKIPHVEKEKKFEEFFHYLVKKDKGLKILKKWLQQVL